MSEEYFLRRYSPLIVSYFEEIGPLRPEEIQKFLNIQSNHFHPFNQLFDMTRQSMHRTEVSCACASLAFCSCP